MRKLKFGLLIGLLLALKSASAFAPFMWAGAMWLAEYVAAPLGYVTGCGLAYTPELRIFGTERGVYGFDWGSMACHARDVYGMQLALCGGSFEHRLCGLQIGLLASGYAAEELPFGGYHFCNLDFCTLHGLQFGTFAAKTATANGIQLSCLYAEAQEINGFQFGIVAHTETLHGLQVGLYNEAEGGLGLQVGLINRVKDHGLECYPILNFVY